MYGGVGHRQRLLGRFVEFVERGLQQLLVGQSGLVFRDQCRRSGAAQCVFDHLVIFGGAEQEADRSCLWNVDGGAFD